jgi:hypothetical protein
VHTIRTPADAGIETTMPSTSTADNARTQADRERMPELGDMQELRCSWEGGGASAPFGTPGETPATLELFAAAGRAPLEPHEPDAAFRPGPNAPTEHQRKGE